MCSAIAGGGILNGDAEEVDEAEAAAEAAADPAATGSGGGGDSLFGDKQIRGNCEEHVDIARNASSSTPAFSSSSSPQHAAALVALSWRFSHFLHNILSNAEMTMKAKVNAKVDAIKGNITR